MRDFYFVETEITEEYIRKVCGSIVTGKFSSYIHMNRFILQIHSTWIFYLDKVAEIRSTMIGIPSPPGMCSTRHSKDFLMYLKYSELINFLWFIWKACLGQKETQVINIFISFHNKAKTILWLIEMFKPVFDQINFNLFT